MAGSDIASKVKSGLAKANKAVGDGVTIVELRQDTVISDPILGDTVTPKWVTLPNAIFKSYDKSLIGTEIMTGDRELISNGDIKIEQGNIVRSNSKEYIVKSVDEVNPAGVVLVYKSQCRGV